MRKKKLNKYQNCKLCLNEDLDFIGQFVDRLVNRISQQNVLVIPPQRGGGISFP